MVSKSRRRREAKERAAKGAPRVRGKRPGPKAKGTISGSMSSTSLRQSGVDVLGVPVISSKAPVGTGLLRFSVNPRNLTGTRLADYAQLWSRWRPISLRLEVSPAAGMMVPGGYIVAWSANPDEPVPAGQAAVVKLASLVTQVQRPIGLTSSLVIPCSATAKWYTFTGEAVDTTHGTILSVVSGAVGVTGDVSVTYKLHWTIEFNGPDLPAPFEEMWLEPAPGWTDIFTDSVSSWADGKKLTFKMHEGGDVVPWQGVQSQVVYKPAAGTKVPYVKADGTSANCEFFSRIINSAMYPSGLACHASEADAKAYQATGDITKVLNYKDAGALATPSIPRLKGTPLMSSFLVDNARISEEPGPSKSSDNDHGLAEIKSLRAQLNRLLLRVETCPPGWMVVNKPRESDSSSGEE